MLAPVILFVYNRPKHTAEVLKALSKNELASGSDLFIFLDGLKPNASPHDINEWDETKRIIHEITWCKSLKIIESDTNKGLSNSVIFGVKKILCEFGKAIVLEDDLVTHHSFLTYMNTALDLYEHEPDVISVHGYIYPIKDLPKTFFIKGADCWGWATWKRGWDLFEPDAEKLLREIETRKLKRRFNFDESYDYYSMLKAQITGRVNSWAVRWYASAFLKDKLTLYPGQSLVRNIGFDGSGTHLLNDDPFNSSEPLSFDFMHLEKVDVKEDINAYQKICTYFADNKFILPKSSLLARIKKTYFKKR